GVIGGPARRSSAVQPAVAEVARLPCLSRRAELWRVPLRVTCNASRERIEAGCSGSRQTSGLFGAEVRRLPLHRPATGSNPQLTTEGRGGKGGAGGEGPGTGGASRSQASAGLASAPQDRSRRRARLRALLRRFTG